jgi:hypothetical protein
LLQTLLHYFSRLARSLKPFRRGLLGLVLLFSLMAVAGLFTSGTGPSLLLQTGLSGTLWSALLLATVDIFHGVPPAPNPTSPWFHRLKRNIVRAFYALLALFVVLSSVALLATSFKLFSV